MGKFLKNYAFRQIVLSPHVFIQRNRVLPIRFPWFGRVNGSD